MKIRLLLFLALSATLSHAQWRAGFFTVGMGQPISQVPWSKLTHLTLCCAAAGDGGAVSKNWLEPSSYPEVLSTARANNVKVLLSIGGPSSILTNNSSSSLVDTFANNITAYIRNNGFDGVDLDWEENINQGQYVDLIRRLRQAMPDKLITIDTGNWGNLVSVSAAAQPYLDRLNVMCYDMAAGAGFSWHNDALLQAGDSTVGACDSRMRALTNAGIPAAKLNVGIPAYGYVFSGASGPQSAGASFSGYQWWYSQILGNPTWWNAGLNKRYDSTHKASYLSVGSTNQFVTYNDTDAVRDIAQWGRSQGVGGFFLAYLYQEYIPGAGGDAMYPLSSALYSALGGGTVASPVIQPLPLVPQLPAVTISPVSVLPGVTTSPAVISTAPSTGSSPMITTELLPAAVSGMPYSLPLQSSGNPTAWSVVRGGLPPGLSLNPSTGLISGTPAASGVYTVVIQVENFFGVDGRQFTLAVVSGG
jgi:chitinase